MTDNSKYELKRFLRKSVFWLILFVILLFFLFPPFWLVSMSLKTLKDTFALPPKFIFTPTFENYHNVFASKKIQFFMLNSLIIAGISTLISLIIGLPGAYSLAQFEFKGKKNLGFFVLSIRIAPPIMSLFPLYIIFNRINLVGTKLSLIIMYVVFNLPLAVWIMQIFFRDISPDIREAAIIDGASEFRAFWNVMLPLTRTGVVATSILCFIQAWNEYLFALVLTGRDSQTLPVAITAFMTYQGVEWGPISAAGVVVMVPMIVFGLMVHKNMVRGMTLGAVKG
jgi:multiple sugar transport system permease protein